MLRLGNFANFSNNSIRVRLNQNENKTENNKTEDTQTTQKEEKGIQERISDKREAIHQQQEQRVKYIFAKITGNVEKATETLMADKLAAPDYSGKVDDSGIENLDKPVAELWVEDDITKDYSRSASAMGVVKMATTLSKKDIDSGAYDKLLQNLAQIKEQLHAYVKAQLEAQGKEYNQADVEKELNYIISDVVNLAIAINVSANSAASHCADYQLKTVQDCVAYIAARVDEKLASGEEFGDTAKSLSLSDDYKLLGTADVFLTEDQKELKEILELLGNDNKQRSCSKELALDALEIYAQHLKNCLIEDEPNLSANEISNIVDKLVETITSSGIENYIKEENGLYDVKQMLLSLATRAKIKCKNF